MKFWRDVHLPLPEGPYVPGCVDVMTDYGKDATFLRLHYPSNSIKNNPSKWINWVPHSLYVNGFSAVTRIWTFVIRFLLWLYSGTLKIPVVWEADVANNTKMPVILFSHGFGASRFICSTLCYELASQGYLVASVEHRDTSAAATYYYASAEDVKKDKRTWIEHRWMDLSNFGPKHYELRNNQIKERRMEVIKAMNALECLNKGELNNILNSSFSLKQFQDKLELSKFYIMGHSFGGATALFTLCEDPRLKLGIILDGWMFPVKNEVLKIRQPLLFLNTQTFHIKSNLNAIQKIVEDGDNRQIYTIVKTNHESQTDSPVALGYWIDWFLKKLDPKEALVLQNHMVKRYLSQTVGFPKDTSSSEEFIKQYDSLIIPELRDFSISAFRPYFGNKKDKKS